jgi:hypothetical protein
MGLTVGVGKGGCVAVRVIVGAAVATVAAVAVTRLAVWAGPEQAVSKKAKRNRSQAIETGIIFTGYLGK